MTRDTGVDRRAFLRYGGATVATATALSMAGCSTDDSGDGNGSGPGSLGDVTITQGEFIETPDPNDHITGPYYNIFDHVYEPLFTITPDIEIEAGVVEDWEAVEDGAATDLMLRDDVVFHNGDDLLASDVAFTMNRIKKPDVGPETDQAAGVPNIEEAEAIDETTVRIHHPDVSPLLAEFQYGQFIRAVKEDWLDTVEIDDETNAISGPDSAEAFNGTGPYQVTEYVPGERIVMEHFDDYWGELPAPETLTWNQADEGRVESLRAGDTDLIDNVDPDNVNAVVNEDGVEIRNEGSLRSIFLVMKEAHEPFDSKEFRQAMNYAVDNQEIIETVLNGFGSPMSQMHAEGVFGYNSDLDPYEQDLDQAESLVEESGYGGVEIELAVGAGRYLEDGAVAETCVDMINQLDNVSCSLNNVEFPRIVEASGSGLDGDPDMPFYLLGWGVITADANYAISPWITPEGPLQSISVPDVWDSLQNTQTQQDIDQREQTLQQINADLREEAPFVFLHSQDSIYGVDNDISWEPRVDESIFAWEME